jgi:hypothetical protein
MIITHATDFLCLRLSIQLRWDEVDLAVLLYNFTGDLPSPLRSHEEHTMLTDHISRTFALNHKRKPRSACQTPVEMILTRSTSLSFHGMNIHSLVCVHKPSHANPRVESQTQTTLHYQAPVEIALARSEQHAAARGGKGGAGRRGVALDEEKYVALNSDGEC